MTDRPIPQPGILDIALYQGGASTAPGARRVIKLSSNENPFGPSPKAMDALCATAATLHRYPPTDHAALRAAIGEVHGLDPARIICGVGSDEILSMLAYAYAGVGDEVIFTEHGFSLYPILVHSAGATPVKVAERDRVVDVDAILAAVTDRTRLVFLTNPGNPTATRVSEADLSRLADGLPGRVVLVLDGAYAEFADGYDGGAGLARARENVVMTRTFSKLYGLGGLRVGWAFGPAGIIDVLNRIRPPFNLANPQLAAAEAAVRDRDWAAFCLAENTRLRAWLVAELRALGLACDDSETNFVLPRFATRADAEAAEARLRADGILVRKVAGYGLPEALRITVGDEEACHEVIRVLSTALGAAA